MRPLAVGLYDISGDALKLRKSVELDVEGASTVVTDLSGEKVADLLLINDRDLSYAKLRFDERSIAYVIPSKLALTASISTISAMIGWVDES